jgi:hypothetical protein
MAITFRGTKGSPLTHDELDQNFREFYYSSSYIGETTRPYGVQLHRSKSLDNDEVLYFPTAVGEEYYIQIKSGSSNVSSSFLTASSNFKYDFDTHHLTVSGSGEMSGDLVVLGTVTAQEFKSELISSSILFDSGSTLFGNTADDTHTFTGSVRVSNGITGSLLSTNGVLSGSIQIASDISGSSTALSSSLAVDIAVNSQASSSLASRVTANSSSIETNATSISTLTAQTSSYLSNTTDTLNGNLTVTGTITAQEFNTEYISSSVIYESGSTKFGDSADDTHTFTGSVDILGRLGITGFTDVSASLAAAVASSGILNVVEDLTPQLGGDLDLNTNSISGSGTINIGGGITSSGLLTVTGTGTSQFSSHLQAHCLGIGTAPSGTTGEIRAAGDITAYYSSDERLKDNITPISDAINKINQIGGYEFDWNSNSSHSGHDVGVIAQEIEKVLPEVVANRDTGYKAVRYEKIVALLIQAIKEQQLQIDELKSKI